MDTFDRYKRLKFRLEKGKEYSDSEFTNEFTNEFGSSCGKNEFTNEFTEEFGTESECYNNGLNVPILWYNGQYQTGKDNVSILAPVIYIEMPMDMKIDYYPRGLQTVRNARIKIHVLSIAPYKSMDNAIQDNKIEQHQKLIDDVHNLLNGFEMKTDSGKIITSQMILQNIAPMKYRSSFVVSVLEYFCEFFKQELII